MNTPIRPGVSATGLNASPRTPQRGISSTFSSPGFRTEEDTVILDIGTRYLRAGLAGDTAPRCTFEYGPEQSRRLGDYRKWLPGYEERARQIKPLLIWTQDHELWQPDLRTFDVGLMEDKLERTIRMAFSEYLLLDAKGRKVVLVAPALTSHTILSKILTILFYNLQISSVNLVPPPTMAVVAAGQRSGLVVDIGWHETIITAVYEFRETLEMRSTRAMKRLLEEVACLFNSILTTKPNDGEIDKNTNLDFQYVEELTTQLVWCRSSSKDLKQQYGGEALPIRLPLPSSKAIDVPFQELSKPVEKALLADSISHREQDDHENALGLLLYKALVRLPPDVRSICMSRIILTGGGSNIPGLKSRLLNDLEIMVDQRGWSPVWRSRHAKEESQPVVESSSNPSVTLSNLAHRTTTETASEATSVETGEEPRPLVGNKPSKPQIHGQIRGIETMGSFVGASLTTTLHIKSLVEIERDVFLQHGLLGPRKEPETVSTRPRSTVGVLTKQVTSESSNLKLGAWA